MPSCPSLTQTGPLRRSQDLLAAASGPRAFTAATGAERTLTVERRTEVLEDHLKALGVAVKGGRLPSLSKAKEVGEKRLLEKEMQVRSLSLALRPRSSSLELIRTLRDVGLELTHTGHRSQELAGNPSKTGLRDGKRVHADSSDDGGDREAGASGSKPVVGEKARKRQVVEERKAFASFLGDQSSDSD